MSRRIIRAFALILICAALLICLPACSGKNDTALTESELSAVQAALGAGAAPEDITSEALSDGRAEKYESVKKVYSTADGHFIFFASPIGYNGPIDIMLIIDGTTAEKTLMQILAHNETDHYVRDFENEWFTGRFAGQSAFTYL